MSEIVIKRTESPTVKVKFGEREFEIKRPKAGMLRGFTKKIADKEQALDALFDFCEMVGVPEDVINDLDMDELSQLFDQLSGMIGQKKTSPSPTS